jgi:hypothetical protein
MHTVVRLLFREQLAQLNFRFCESEISLGRGNPLDKSYSYSPDRWSIAEAWVVSRAAKQPLSGRDP